MHDGDECEGERAVSRVLILIFYVALAAVCWLLLPCRCCLVLSYRVCVSFHLQVRGQGAQDRGDVGGGAQDGQRGRQRRDGYQGIYAARPALRTMITNRHSSLAHGKKFCGFVLFARLAIVLKVVVSGVVFPPQLVCFKCPSNLFLFVFPLYSCP